MNTDTIRIPAETIRDMMGRIFAHVSVPPVERDTVVKTLMEASLSGYHSHGIVRVPMYVEGIRSGTMIPGSVPRVLNDTSSAVHLDAAFALGPVTAVDAVSRATDKAQHTGIGCVSVVNANDVARLGSYMAAPALSGFIAIMMVNDAGGNPAVAPWGSTQAFLSTNPLAAGIPWRDGCPIVIDMSTSVAAAGRLKTLHAQGLAAPEGWLLDESGQPTCSVAEAVSMPPTHPLLPLGGMLAGHKGFALSILVDVLAGGLGGAGLSAGEVSETERNGLCVIVLDPDAFIGREAFTDQVSRFVASMKDLPTMSDCMDVMVPGERAWGERQKRLADGIPVEKPIWDRIEELMTDLGIPLSELPGADQ